MDYKELFIRALKKNNPDLNLLEDFPLYDVLIAPASDMLDEIDSSLNAAELKMDISNYFDDEGLLKSDEYFTILKNNYALSDQFSEKATVTVYLLSEVASDTVNINTDVEITRDNKTFIIPASEYTNITWQSRDGYFAFPVLATAFASGSDYTEVTPGTWEANTIISTIIGFVTDDYPTGGAELTDSVTQERISTVINNKGWDNTAALIEHLYEDIFTEEPAKLAVIGLNEENLESGIIAVESDYLQTGNTADIRMDFAQVTASEVITGTYQNSTFEYTFSAHVPVYGIVSVVDLLGNAVTFKMDYFTKTLSFETPKVRVTYTTSDYNEIDFVRQVLSGYTNNHIGSLYSVKTFYPVSIYVDVNCFKSPGTTTATQVADVNTTLNEFILPSDTFSTITFQSLFTEVFDKTTYAMEKFYVRLGGRTGHSDEATYIEEIGPTPLSGTITNAITFTKNNYDFTLSDENSIMIGGLV